MTGQELLRRLTIPDKIFYPLKELSMLRGNPRIAPLALEIFQDYIRQHQHELLKVN